MIHKASSTIAHVPSLLIISSCSGGTYSQRQRKTDSIVSLKRRSSSQFVFDFRYSAYEIYADPKSDELFSSWSQTRAARRFWASYHKARHSSSDSENLNHANDPEPKTMAKLFKKTFSRDVKVHFVGAWCVVRFWDTHDCTWGIAGTLFHQSESSEARIFPSPIRQSIFASFVTLSHSMNAE
jgi:hypothetical protein